MSTPSSLLVGVGVAFGVVLGHYGIVHKVARAAARLRGRGTTKHPVEVFTHPSHHTVAAIQSQYSGGAGAVRNNLNDASYHGLLTDLSSFVVKNPSQDEWGVYYVQADKVYIPNAIDCDAGTRVSKIVANASTAATQCWTVRTTVPGFTQGQHVRLGHLAQAEDPIKNNPAVELVVAKRSYVKGPPNNKDAVQAIYMNPAADRTYRQHEREGNMEVLVKRLAEAAVAEFQKSRS